MSKCVNDWYALIISMVYDFPAEMGILRTVSVPGDSTFAGAHGHNPTSSVSPHTDWVHDSVIQMRIEQMPLRLERATRGGGGDGYAPYNGWYGTHVAISVLNIVIFEG